MRVLLLNTCGDEGVVALAGEDGVVAEERLGGRASSEQLLPALRRVFATAGWETRELEAVAVVHGPGSFTGVRVGLGAAKGLCDALGVPMVAMSRLGLVAAAGGDGEVVAVLDGGRGEFYCGVYRSGGMVREMLLARSALLEVIGGGVAVTCEARVAEGLEGVRLVPEPGAEDMLRMARGRIAAGDWADVGTIDANYLRRTDAELLVERRNAVS